MPGVLSGSGGLGPLTLESHLATDFSSMFQVSSSSFSMLCVAAMAICFAAMPRAVSFKSMLSVLSVLSNASSLSVQGSGVGGRDILRHTAMCCSLLLEDGILQAFHWHKRLHSGRRNFFSLVWLKSRVFIYALCFSISFDVFQSVWSIFANSDLQRVRALALKKSSAFKCCPPVAKNIHSDVLAFWMAWTRAVELGTVMAGIVFLTGACAFNWWLTCPFEVRWSQQQWFQHSRSCSNNSLLFSGRAVCYQVRHTKHWCC